ncbi:hypothetical protein SAMN05192584_13151 [Streptomyces pini]|uniref:HTH IS21-type domain-containing protein n=1 Tax=Streptomyces pini TaxID=1520580 RepID=A0A1I4LI33_9ACTN|nr:hypothetical protein [Streptomyces pini]SFL90630.1 hypothetical protein SAMN05192584_13151 [Streptomyces pini]
MSWRVCRCRPGHLEVWLRARPGVEGVCRDGSATHAEAIRRALPEAVQVAGRWHIWHDSAEVVRTEIAVHGMCWAKTGLPLVQGKQAATTHERWQQIHDLRERGVGPLECARRLNLALNTVKRYDRVPESLVRALMYRPALVDPYREHLRGRRERNLALPVTHLLREIKELDYTGSANLLVRYITQGCVEADRPALSLRCLAHYLLTRPGRLKDHRRGRVEAARAAADAALPCRIAMAVPKASTEIQDDQASDVRPRELPATSTPDPARLTITLCHHRK